MRQTDIPKLFFGGLIVLYSAMRPDRAERREWVLFNVHVVFFSLTTIVISETIKLTENHSVIIALVKGRKEHKVKTPPFRIL